MKNIESIWSDYFADWQVHKSGEYSLRRKLKREVVTSLGITSKNRITDRFETLQPSRAILLAFCREALATCQIPELKISTQRVLWRWCRNEIRGAKRDWDIRWLAPPEYDMASSDDVALLHQVGTALGDLPSQMKHEDEIRRTAGEHANLVGDSMLYCLDLTLNEARRRGLSFAQKMIDEEQELPVFGKYLNAKNGLPSFKELASIGHSGPLAFAQAFMREFEKLRPEFFASPEEARKIGINKADRFFEQEVLDFVLIERRSCERALLGIEQLVARDNQFAPYSLYCRSRLQRLTRLVLEHAADLNLHSPLYDNDPSAKAEAQELRDRARPVASLKQDTEVQAGVVQRPVELLDLNESFSYVKWRNRRGEERDGKFSGQRAKFIKLLFHAKDHTRSGKQLTRECGTQTDTWKNQFCKTAPGKLFWDDCIIHPPHSQSYKLNIP